MNFDGPAEASLIARNLSGLGAATVQPFFLDTSMRNIAIMSLPILSFTPAPT